MTTSTNKRHWEARELVLVGVFAAAAKLSSLLIALAFLGFQKDVQKG